MQPVAALKSASPDERLRAAEALCAMGESAAPAAVELVDACADPDERVREAAVAALEGLGTPLAHGAEPLVAKLGAADAAVAYWAATLLGRMGAAAEQAVEPLAGIVAGDHAPIEVRQRAAWALGQIGPAAASAIPALETAQTKGDVRLANLAAVAVSSINRAT